VGGEFATWPPMPWIAAGLVRWLYEPVHREWWRFAPCDAYGQPRELPFADTDLSSGE
jgi:hypothetical protein